jgi:hypothetical protein
LGHPYPAVPDIIEELRIALGGEVRNSRIGYAVGLNFLLKVYGCRGPVQILLSEFFLQHHPHQQVFHRCLDRHIGI